MIWCEVSSKLYFLGFCVIIGSTDGTRETKKVMVKQGPYSGYDKVFVCPRWLGWGNKQYADSRLSSEIAGGDSSSIGTDTVL